MSGIRTFLFTVGLGCGSLISTSAMAAVISFTPGSAAVPVSPAFGSLVSGGALGTNYKNFGVDFSYGNIEGIFNDGGGVLAFGGVNSGGVVDLLTPVDGRIVLPGTLTTGATNFFYAEAGFAEAGSLTLSLFDSSLHFIASVLNGSPLGLNDRTTFSYSGSGVSYFRISGNDTWGADEIRLNTPTAISAVPLPPAVLLLGSALFGIGGLGRLRSKKASKA